MSFIRRPVVPPEHPVLVIALDGWIDAGFAAMSAMNELLEQNETRTYALFGSDELLDYRTHRPQMRIRDGLRRRIYWPEIRLRVGRDAAGRGLALLVGPEPDYHWRPFAAEVVSLARDLGTRLVVGLGAFPAPVPHTRPVSVTTTASEESFAREVGYVPGRLIVPAGIGEVLGAACSEAGIPSVGLWARVPHYVASSSYPPASLALLSCLANLAGIAFDPTELEAQTEESLQQVAELIEQSEEYTEMVRDLEEQYERGEGAMVAPERSIPSADEIAAELERYLRGELS